MKNNLFAQRTFLFQILILLGSGFSSALWAHDFWLEAQPFYTSPGKTVELSIHVGSKFTGDTLPNITDWYNDFSIYDQADKTPVSGELGRDPAGFFTPKRAGTYAIGYQSTFSYVEIDPATFLKYIKEEGLDNALQYRREHHLTEQMAKENFIRHAKILVQAGDQYEVDHSARIFGYELEIIPLTNPYQTHPGESLSIRVLYQGKAAADILVQAIPKAAPEQKIRQRTDSNGIASFTLDQAGAWLVKAVKLVRINGDKADWQSHWASLTFELK